MFLAVILGLVLIATTQSTYNLLTTGHLEGLCPSLLAWMIAGIAGGVMSYHYGLVTTFTFDPDRLTVRRSFLRYQRQEVLERRTLRYVKQVYDGKQPFPTWGLTVETPRTFVLLARQPRDRSEWLGQIIAAWARRPYDRCPKHGLFV